MSNHSILDFSYQKLEDYIVGLLGKKFYASQIWRWIYRNYVLDFDEMSNLPLKLRNILKSEKLILPFLDYQNFLSKDGTQKFIFTLQDGKEIEAVLIPEKNRRTICLSSQVGCKFGCDFCATGKLGFSRNLSCSEIVGQVLVAQQYTDKKITNLVYMGMGEPLDNYDNVLKSADILNTDQGYGIGSRKITISTFGLIPGIERIISEDVRYGLAISLHTPFEQQRSIIMPATAKYNLENLFNTLKKYAQLSKRKIVFEYTMMSGVNISRKAADSLVSLLSGLPAKLNLICFHDNPFSNYCAPLANEIDDFYRYLQAKAPFPVMIRASRGNDIAAACGQLRAERENFILN